MFGPFIFRNVLGNLTTFCFVTCRGKPEKLYLFSLLPMRMNEERKNLHLIIMIEDFVILKKN